MTDAEETTTGARLRAIRQARELSQYAVARMAGVSRQAVSNLESGLSEPSLRVAFALSRALGVSVEELFGPANPATPVPVRPVAPPGGDGARVTLASVGDQFVALPLRGGAASRSGFLPASGLISQSDDDPAGTGEARPVGTLRPTLVAAGCDPALPLLEAPLALLDPPIAFTWWQCSSRQALALAAAGLVHVAGTHLRWQGDDHATSPAAELLPQGGQVIRFSCWQEGLVLRPELAGEVSGIKAAARLGLRLVNREPGAEARSLLDRELTAAGIQPGQLPGYNTQATGHLHVAAAIAAGLADAGIASEPAALAYGLAFIPLASEHFDLVIPAAHINAREVQGLLKVLSSTWLLDQIANLPGYDPARCGEQLGPLQPVPSSA